MPMITDGDAVAGSKRMGFRNKASDVGNKEGRKKCESLFDVESNTQANVYRGALLKYK
jgi:hypothetical protein